MADNDADIEAKQDAALYYYLSGYKKHEIFKGFGNEFDILVNGLNATLKSGGAMCYGHHLYADGSDTQQLPSNSTFYIVIRIDLTQPANNEANFTNVSLLKQEDIINDGNIYDIPLFKVTTGVNAITKQEDLRNISDRNLIFLKK